MSITLPVSNFVKEHLRKKGITTDEEASRYLYPDIRNLHPAMDVDGIKDAVELFVRHLKKRSYILFVGDYDVDGVMSMSILSHGAGPLMREYGAKGFLKFPNRVEGYGLNLEVLKRLISKKKPDLVVTIDNGVKSVEEIRFLKDNGIDVIVLDHHAPDMENLPDPDVLVDLHLPGTTYPFKELCGAAVGYKFVEALHEYLGKPFTKQMELLQYAALATLADVVSLTGENRLIVQLGIRFMNSNPAIGIKALIKAFGIQGEITTEHIGYSLGPSINAPGRILIPDHAFALFKTTDETKAKAFAENLVRYNDERKEMTTRFVDMGFDEISKYPDDDVYVVELDDCPEGIVGLVAGKIKERFNKPAIVLAKHGEYYTGSARSIPAFNIVDELKHFEDLMIRFGGHSMAAGLSISPENVDKLRKGLNERAKITLTPEDFEKQFDVEKEVLSNTDIGTYFEDLKLLEPFGSDNPRPVFKINFTPRAPKFKEDGSYIDILKELHLKIYGDSFVNAIGFNFAEEADSVLNKNPIPLIGEISENIYKGFRSYQINILQLG